MKNIVAGIVPGTAALAAVAAGGIWGFVLLTLALAGIYLMMLIAEPTAQALGEAFRRLISRLWA